MREHGAAKRAAMRAGWAISSLKDWTDYRRRKTEFKAETRGVPVHPINEPLGHRTRHTYKIADGKALTTFQMDQRWSIVARLYPEKLTSLLDIGCCRGWFVIRAAMQPECERALGIDVVQGFIDAANEAKKLLKLDDKAQFDYAFLDDVAGNPQKYRTPYQTIVLLNTYHYMYWGSGYSDKHWPDHDYLLRTLADICTDRIIFMSPLEVHDCPSDIAKRAREHPDWAAPFTTKRFLEVAGRYFDVSHESYMGLRPLYLMRKR
jgi:SAM-dependent methyltransferase